MRLVQVNALFFPLTMMLVGLSVIITIYFGGKQVIAGTFSFGNIAEYVIYVNMLTWPVASLGWVTSIIQRASASQERINHFLEETPENRIGIDSFDFDKAIEFKNVSFSYDNTTVLSNLDFTIEKGQTIGIIGTTGSGKSTLASLLMRLYSPNEGTISIDGNNVNDLSLPAYRSLFGYVPQDIFLFSESIRDNILFGSETEKTESDIESITKLTDVWDDIQGFTNKLDTVLGERGITLSGGQKQRVAIARALIRDPEILILDDSLSAVDTHTERSIKQNLKAFGKNKTVVLISHRVSTVEDADFILVLDEGRIVEQGAPSQLLVQNGLFSEMVKTQNAQNQPVS